MNTLEKAIRLNALNAAKKRIEDDITALKQEILDAYPDAEHGIAPPFFIARPYPRVELYQGQSQAFYMKHKDLRSLFKLSLSVDDFNRIGTDKIGQVNTSFSLLVDKKAVDAAAQDAGFSKAA